MTDQEYMERAIQLAQLAKGHTDPNPMVGAVVVKNGRIIGQGYHHRAGEPHAEVHALRMAGEQARGATLYVTLEPCAHYGKTPPCADLVVSSGIRTVYIGSLDPNPLVAGKGIAILQEAGVKVHTGLLEEECVRMNEHFFTYIQTQRPFVTLKSAMSLDGKIATSLGESQWITREGARKDGHRLRATHSAMLVGIGTVLADNPSLNCRLSLTDVYGDALDLLRTHTKDTDSEGIPCNLDGSPLTVHQPDVIVLDSKGRTPSQSKLFAQEGRRVRIMVGSTCSDADVKRLREAGALVHVLPERERDKGLSIPHLLEALGLLGYQSILVEGGSRVMASFVEAKAFDCLVSYIGDLVIGGERAMPAIGGHGYPHLIEAPKLCYQELSLIDNTVKLVAYRREREGAYVHRNH